MTDRIELLVLDVDGVLTDGCITYDSDGRELKTFNSRDGFGVKLWNRTGHRTAIITGRGGEAVRRRAQDLGIEHVIERREDKGTALEELLSTLQVPLAQVAYVGDDWPDLSAMRLAGMPIAVHDAVASVRLAASAVTTAPGGHGAVREAVEMLLRHNGEWQAAMDLFGAREERERVASRQDDR
ncbi:MAG: HAD hydrolase family protein [Planctomycetota bacterium]